MVDNQALQIVSVVIGLPIAFILFYFTWILIAYSIGRIFWFFRRPILLLLKLASYAMIGTIIYIGFATVMLAMGDATYFVVFGKFVGNLAMNILHGIDTVQRNIGNALASR